MPDAPPPPSSTQRHLERVREFYEAAPVENSAPARGYRRLLAHYYNLLIPSNASVLEIGCGSGELLSALRASSKTGVDLSANQIEAARRRLPEAHFVVGAGEDIDLEDSVFDVIIISDTLNVAADVQQLLSNVRRFAGPNTRLIVNFHNSLWRPILTLGRWLGIKSAQPNTSWLAASDVLNLLGLADWALVSRQNRIVVPVPLLGLDWLANRWLAPLLQWFCLTVFLVARPVRSGFSKPPTVSVVIPARNEAGNIEAAVRRTPAMGGGTELIFVEGHSRDETWAEIQRVAKAFPERRIKILQQTGRGKGDAVRAGFAVASGDILMILDADLTMPPE